MNENSLVFAAKFLGKVIETTLRYQADGKIGTLEKLGYAQFLDDVIKFILARKDILEDIKNFNHETEEAIMKAFCDSVNLKDELLEAKFEIGMEMILRAAELANDISDFVLDLKDG